MAKDIAFAQFMSNQGLSHADTCKMFACTQEESRNWANGNPPPEVSKTARILNQLLERIKLEDMPDIDRQNFEHRAEIILKENESLKIENTRLKKALNGLAPKKTKALNGSFKQEANANA